MTAPATQPGEHIDNIISWALLEPDRVAIVMGSGDSVTYGQLADRACRLVNALRSRGVQTGDVVAVLSENTSRYHEVTWACRLAGFYFAPINSHLGVDEVAYILADCGASVLVASANLDVTAQLTPEVAPDLRHRMLQFDELPGWESYDAALAGASSQPPAPGPQGDLLQYSSGTTGRPKGIKRDLLPSQTPLSYDAVGSLLAFLLGANEKTVYLAPAPLYHSAPIMWSMAVHRLGGTVVLMERFDPETALRLIDEHRITHGQFVPTMFVRMLKLPEAVRSSYDVSSLQSIIHAAAPCPVDVKRAMIEWWGPVVHEYWSSSEGAGFTYITAEDWLAHPGSVGKPLMGTLHICDEAGEELPTGEAGMIWSAGMPEFSYLNDDAKNAETTHPRGWRTVGDIGRVDADGYLYLTDRASFTIISGGVNIYPQEAENVLLSHPAVLDAAVIGIPHDELGEVVHAVVQPVDWAEVGDELAAELLTWCRDRLAVYKCPRSLDFDPALPRLDTGKLYKKQLRQRYL